MSFLSQLLMQLPSFLIALTGFVLAGIFMKRASTAAILVIIASILTLLQSTLAIFNHLVLLEMMIDGQLSDTAYSIIVSGGFTLFYVAISALMLCAAFAGRSAQTAPQTQPNSAENITTTHANLTPHRGGMVLTFGLLGLLLFAPLGIAAWVMGNKDLASMREGHMDKSGEGTTLAGKILGILATTLMIFGVIVFFGAMAVLASSYRGF